MSKIAKHSYQTKVEIVSKYLEGQSVNQLVEEYQLSHRSRIYGWTKKVKQGGYEALKDQRGKKSLGRPPKPKQTSTDYQEWLENENKRLNLKVEYLKKLIDLERR